MPYEKYDTRSFVRSVPSKCWVCAAVIGDGDVAIVRRDGKRRHEKCGGPPAPDRPAKSPAKKEGGQAGAAGNAQGRVIRKGSSLS